MFWIKWASGTIVFTLLIYSALEMPSAELFIACVAAGIFIGSCGTEEGD